MGKGVFGRLGPGVIIILVMGTGITTMVSGGHLLDAWRPILLLALYLGYFVWRERKIVRDPDYAERQAQEEASPWRQAQRGAMKFFWGFAALLVLLLLANTAFPQILEGVDPVKGEMVVTYVGILGPVAFMAWRSLR